MNKREIPAALRRAAEQLPMPHSQELWEMPVSKQTELDYITAQELPQVPTRRRAFLPALTCCIVLLFLAGFGSTGWWRPPSFWMSIPASRSPPTGGIEFWR